MNTENPYESPAHNATPQRWRRIDFLAAGLWIMIPIAVVVGRQILMPMFDDFGVELATSTQYLLNFYTAVSLAIAAVIVLVLMFTIHGASRPRISWVAFAFGIFVCTACILSILGPLLSLWRGLS